VTDRPIGVSIIAIIYMIRGITGLLSGVAFSLILPNSFNIFTIIGMVFIISSLIQLLVAYGLWEMKAWAFILAILIELGYIMSSMNVISFLPSPPLGTFGLILNMIVIIYLIIRFPR